LRLGLYLLWRRLWRCTALLLRRWLLWRRLRLSALGTFVAPGLPATIRGSRLHGPRRLLALRRTTLGRSVLGPLLRSLLPLLLRSLPLPLAALLLFLLLVRGPLRMCIRQDDAAG
jgi:hypothetical protein